MFLVAGYLVLFITFVVRDILLDRARTMADTLSVAESAYLLEEATIQLNHEIDEVDGHVMDGDRDILSNFPSHRPTIHVNMDILLMLGRDSLQSLRIDSETNAEFSSLERLLEVLPSDDKRREAFSTLYTRWDKDQMELLGPLRSIEEKVDPAISTAEAAQNTKRSQDMWAINGQLQILASEILDDAHKTLGDKENQVEVFARWSYLLYFTGGILALGSKLVGVETAGA